MIISSFFKSSYKFNNDLGLHGSRRVEGFIHFISAMKNIFKDPFEEFGFISNVFHKNYKGMFSFQNYFYYFISLTDKFCSIHVCQQQQLLHLGRLFFACQLIVDRSLWVL